MVANEESIKALDEHRAATQFGGLRANPHSSELGAKPWSIRNSLRHLAKSAPVTETADGKAKLVLPKQATVAQRIAATALEVALDKEAQQHMRAVEFTTEQIDGKLAQMNVNAGLAELEGKSLEELDEIERQLDEQLANASRAHLPEAAEAAGDQETSGTPEGAAGAIGNGAVEDV